MSSGDDRMPDGRTLDEYLNDYDRTKALIASGTPPSEEEIANAPLIFNWAVRVAEDPIDHSYKYIVGHFEGHPFLSTGAFGRTSPLLQLARDLRWARCRSRLYRLERPLPSWMTS